MHEIMRTKEWIALMENIRALPDEDLPRLTAADYVEERGQHDYANFIRAQIALTKPIPTPWETIRSRTTGKDYEIARSTPEMRQRHEEATKIRGDADVFVRGNHLRFINEFDDFFYPGINWTVDPHFFYPGINWTVDPHFFYPGINWTVDPHYDNVPPSHPYVFDRGFVAIARVRMIDWFGRPCGMCRGGGETWEETGPGEVVVPVTCTRCNGTGYQGSMGPKITRLATLKSIIVIDMMAASPYSPGMGNYWWCELDGDYNSYSIPSPIFHRMKRPSRPFGSAQRVGYKSYSTAEEANEDLSQAMIGWAKDGGHERV